MFKAFKEILKKAENPGADSLDTFIKDEYLFIISFVKIMLMKFIVEK